MDKSIRNLFQIRENVHFLNHGSFGACPKKVFQAYQDWQRSLEEQPVAFLGREIGDLLDNVRRRLGAEIGASPDDLVFVPNVTHGVNIVARSLKLGGGDEILITNHEYGACKNTWEFISKKTGALVKEREIMIPIAPTLRQEEIADQFLAGITEKTKLIFISHITSPTALRLPVEIICQKARQLGILTIIDGAHAPGQIPLNIAEISADFYTGNCHKWMMSAKGAGFLYVRPDTQHLIEPLVVSWGYSAPLSHHNKTRLATLLEWTGTFDPAPYLSISAALDFADEYNWDFTRDECENLLQVALDRINEITGIDPIYPNRKGWYRQMGIVELPGDINVQNLKLRLYNDFHVEIPTIEWMNRKFLRISIQGYNSEDDIDALVAGIKCSLE